MRKTMVAMAVAVAALIAIDSTPAKATPYSFDFTGTNGAATAEAIGTFDVVGGQAISGSGTLTVSDHGISGDVLQLVTLSTPGVHDLGGGNLSYRFGGGTDLIGDTAVPVDSGGPVFIDTTSLLDVGFNFWWNGGTSYTGFLAGNDGIYESYNGSLTVSQVASVPEPSSLLLVVGLAAMWFGRKHFGNFGNASA